MGLKCPNRKQILQRWPWHAQHRRSQRSPADPQQAFARGQSAGQATGRLSAIPTDLCKRYILVDAVHSELPGLGVEGVVARAVVGGHARDVADDVPGDGRVIEVLPLVEINVVKVASRTPM